MYVGQWRYGFFALVKLMQDGKLVDIPIKSHEGPFKGRDGYDRLHSTKFSAGLLPAFVHVQDENLFRSRGRECDAATASAALV